MKNSTWVISESLYIKLSFIKILSIFTYLQSFIPNIHICLCAYKDNLPQNSIICRAIVYNPLSVATLTFSMLLKHNKCKSMPPNEILSSPSFKTLLDIPSWEWYIVKELHYTVKGLHLNSPFIPWSLKRLWWVEVTIMRVSVHLFTNQA